MQHHLQGALPYLCQLPRSQLLPWFVSEGCKPSSPHPDQLTQAFIILGVVAGEPELGSKHSWSSGTHLMRESYYTGMCELAQSSCRSVTTSKAEVNSSSDLTSSTNTDKSTQKLDLDQLFVEPEEGNSNTEHSRLPLYPVETSQTIDAVGVTTLTHQVTNCFCHLRPLVPSNHCPYNEFSSKPFWPRLFGWEDNYHPWLLISFKN